MQTQSPPEDIKKLPSVFVIFGATGDLARKKIFPSFFELFKNSLLPEKFKIIAAARSPFTTEEFLQILTETVDAKDKDWDKFGKLIEYFQCDVEQDINLAKLEAKLEGIEKSFGDCAQRIFYMAISPYIYESAFDMLGKHNLHIGCKNHGKKTRIVIEKPFGYNYESSQILNQKLSALYDETQIFRIDHFLGKETVQNIFAFRFANEIFEPIWNNKYIDNIQITNAEYVGVERRGKYYDRAGALRDVVQNHLLQLLAIATMEEPTKFNQASIREKKLEVLKSIKKLTPEEVESSTVRSQYEGYLSEEKVDPMSTTETYAMVKLEIENERWKGVPIYLRTGKKLTGKVTSIIFSFKENIHELYKETQKAPLPNHIVIQIQPNEGIGIRIIAKKPGLTTQLEPVDMEFCYKTSFNEPQPDAYERLLMDIIVGDQTLFIGQVGESWKIIDPIREVWDRNKPNLATYKPGSWGPQEAEDIIKKDGREWLAPLLTICKI
jgi:glucose-6-phosphate 1-dehydrogenase